MLVCLVFLEENVFSWVVICGVRVVWFLVSDFFFFRGEGKGVRFYERDIGNRGCNYDVK